jgi:hypothetical protein
MSTAIAGRAVSPAAAFAALACLIGSAPLGASPTPQERAAASSSRTVTVQGAGQAGLEPASGAPEAPASPTAAVEASAKPGRPGAAAAPADPLAARLKAVATAEGEATVELDGVRQVVRAGSRHGADVVKSVGPDRIVLERAPEPGRSGGAALVIVRFDAAGRARPTVLWTADPAAAVAPEVKRP